MSHDNVYLYDRSFLCYIMDGCICCYTAGALGGVKDQLTKVMLQGAYATTIPVRNANDTVDAKLGISLIQVIELVWTQELSLKQCKKAVAVQKVILLISRF